MKTHVVLDLPVGTCSALIVLGLVGLIPAVVASLEGGQEQTLGVDKILHFLGYASLADSIKGLADDVVAAKIATPVW
jgi:hypothetical protein